MGPLEGCTYKDNLRMGSTKIFPKALVQNLKKKFLQNRVSYKQTIVTTLRSMLPGLVEN